MRHKKKYLKLNRKTSHRMSMLDNMVASVIEHGAIVTTVSKAKALRPYFERVLTKVKNNLNSLDVRREIVAQIGRDFIVAKLYNDVVKSIANRNGGYTRITKICQRKADGAVMAKIELVD